MAIAGTKETGKFIENPYVKRVVFPLTGMGGSLTNFAFNFADFILLFIQIEFNWITNKSCLYRNQTTIDVSLFRYLEK